MKNEKKGAVKFVRIRGRVIPIRQGKAKQVAQGTALAVVGTGIAAGSGKAGTKITDLAIKRFGSASWSFNKAKFSRWSNNPTGDFTDYLKNKISTMENAKDDMIVSRNGLKFSRAIKIAGTSLGGALIGRGLYRAVYGKKKSDRGKEVATAVGGVAGVAAGIVGSEGIKSSVGYFKSLKLKQWLGIFRKAS